MIKYSFLLLISLLLFVRCSDSSQFDYYNKELTSSRGEKIYVKTIIWGMTGDYQKTIITKKEGKPEESDFSNLKDDTGLTSFMYSFTNDTLNLYFNQTITYKVEETFNTIFVKYHILSNPEYNNLIPFALREQGYYIIPPYK